jgi:hypothetical protein
VGVSGSVEAVNDFGFWAGLSFALLGLLGLFGAMLYAVVEGRKMTDKIRQ